jgi:hypothetical protein
MRRIPGTTYPRMGPGSIMPPIEYVLSLLRQSTSGRGSRSTAMKDLNWLVAAVLAALVALVAAKADLWIIIAVLILLVAVIGRWLWAHHSFAERDPDLLRSEWYSLERIALEQKETLRGDDRTGLVTIEVDEEARPNIPPPALPEDREGGKS